MTAFTWSDAAVREALGLRTDLTHADDRFAGVSTDTRRIGEGHLYVALKGERFDGHDFVQEAFAAGAGAAVVSRPVPGDGGRLYAVKDTLVALGALAAHRRRALEVPVVAITGSAGKTTTKDLTAAALATRMQVHATLGNLNNRVGMPLTLLDAPEEAEVVVLELGSNEPGEIATLAAIARPDVGVVTTVGESHLEKLGSLEGVLEEKLHLLRRLAEGGRCVVGDEPAVLVERARALCPHVRVAGWSERADQDLKPGAAEGDVFGGFRFRWRGQSVALGLPGKHAVTDAMLALAVADLLEVPPKDAARGLAAVEPAGLRGELRRIGGLTLIVDCYNANPQSVRVALELLEGQAAADRRVAVLGTMLELGEASDELHGRVLEGALARRIELVVATGAFAEAAAVRGIVEDDRLLLASGWAEAYPRLRDRLAGQEVVLLKASRGVAMEGILPLLEADFGGAEPGAEEEEA